MKAPDIIDDGEKLYKISDCSQDFVISSHMLEHCIDPIEAIENMIRVLKPGGILYLIIPDKKYIFDVNRPITPLQHLISDHKRWAERSLMDHYIEWSTIIDKKTGEDAIIYAKELREKGINVHFHVWTQAEIIELIAYLKRVLLFEVELITRYGVEVICILRKI